MRRLALLLAVLVALAWVGAPASAPAADAAGASALLSSMNAARSAAGLPAYTVDASLMAKAAGWAETMASRTSVMHSSLTAGISEPWTALGENVGSASDVPAMAGAFLSSPEHRANILSRRFRNVGVGVAYGPDGLVYAAEVFLAPDGSTVSPAPTAPPAPAPSSTAPSSTTPRATTSTRAPVPTVRTLPADPPPCYWCAVLAATPWRMGPRSGHGR